MRPVVVAECGVLSRATLERLGGAESLRWSETTAAVLLLRSAAASRERKVKSAVVVGRAMVCPEVIQWSWAGVVKVALEPLPSPNFFLAKGWLC